MTRFSGFWLALALAMAPVLATAQVYRWVDDRGQVHYSQVPPPGKSAEQVGAPPPPAAAPNQESLNQSLKDAGAAAPAQKAEADRMAQNQAALEQFCKQTREQLAYLDAKTPQRITTTNDKGEVSRISEPEFQQRRNELLKSLSERCS
jgi:hypothetical protein